LFGISVSRGCIISVRYSCSQVSRGRVAIASLLIQTVARWLATAAALVRGYFSVASGSLCASPHSLRCLPPALSVYRCLHTRGIALPPDRTRVCRCPAPYCGPAFCLPLIKQPRYRLLLAATLCRHYHTAASALLAGVGSFPLLVNNNASLGAYFHRVSLLTASRS
jgi:hypothetical protein